VKVSLQARSVVVCPLLGVFNFQIQHSPSPVAHLPSWCRLHFSIPHINLSAFSIDVRLNSLCSNGLAKPCLTSSVSMEFTVPAQIDQIYHGNMNERGVVTI
jgi:hypothetical protein